MFEFLRLLAVWADRKAGEAAELEPGPTYQEDDEMQHEEWAAEMAVLAVDPEHAEAVQKAEERKQRLAKLTAQLDRGLITAEEYLLATDVELLADDAAIRRKLYSVKDVLRNAIEGLDGNRPDIAREKIDIALGFLR